jgi:hypothetical protein
METSQLVFSIFPKDRNTARGTQATPRQNLRLGKEKKERRERESDRREGKALAQNREKEPSPSDWAE